MSAPNRPRKRPHPASGARRLAGWLSVAAVFGLTGGMAVASKTTKTSTTSTAAAQSATQSTSAASSDDESAAQRAAIANALAGNTASQSVTVTHAS